MVVSLINHSADFLVNNLKLQETIVPGALGGFGGWATGIGFQRGFLQGFVTGTLNVTFLSPLKKYIDSNTVWNSKDISVNKFNRNANYVIRFIVFISSIALPLIFMNKYSDKVLNKVGSLLPSDKEWLVIPGQDTKPYTYALGLYTQMVPGLISTAVSIFGR